MIVDTHIHTRFSSDSKMHINQALQRSEELGIGITLTEHMDLAYPEPDAFTFDIHQYLTEYGPYRSHKVMLGVEIGMRLDCLTENRRLIAANPFDYVIGSIHVIENIDIYQEVFYRERSKQEVYQQYFAAMAECLSVYECIDTLGHIDYIARYARYSDPELYYSEFAAAIDKVLTLTAQHEKAIEINTRRLSSPAAVQALLPIYQRFYQLGGRLATIGSDAHNADDIGRDFRLAMQLAELSNLKPVYFSQRRPHYIK
ncbi:histidinol phosphate phosphatase|uniref:Histidinol-phosphatase n=1 Tax=Dendrosporobacter quercicolus TaxID=146817 RepID=A0A1G9LQQ7_9FIRM|nr:histidinol phosphate phosphatase [Dendrosporobacter quercicolus]NSL46800.1 histidinol phosphate phosphatase [Dendrosporobacter quercicolus DSM 1736]SDL64276.1 histidinol-phosphatase (PHP family) [Dendrosporobacter quercicolus]